MKVYLAEKKSQGHDLANVIEGGNTYEDKKTYINLSNGDIVTWCAGHLLELAPPEYYNSSYKNWSLDNLPISPEVWRWLPIEKSKFQLSVVTEKIKKATEVVICSDFDREGQLLAINVLNFCNYMGKTSRVKLTATDNTSIKRALSNIEDLEHSMSLYKSALVRAKCDWLVGINLTRLFTCLANGKAGIINIGRVLTPTINLIVDRDKKIKDFKSREYYEIEATLDVKNGSFKVNWEIPDELCEDGHCFDIDKVRDIYSSLQDKTVTISQYEQKQVSEQPPLLFSLSALQIYAAKKFDLSPKEVLDICQSLYDSRHKLTSYPRTDCQYLPESQFADAPIILENLAKSTTKFKSLIAGCDTKIKSRVFNDKKMQNHAHNAIIPSLGEQDITSLTENELKIYNTIVQFYLAQFYPNAEYDQIKVTAICNKQKFVATGKTLIKPGYKICLNEITEDKEQLLPPMKQGEIARFRDIQIVSKKTKAPKRFDYASLIETMTNISKLIDNPNDKKILDETYGLGTEPTRPVIIENILKYGYATLEEKKYFKPTEKAISIMAALPVEIKSAKMTATWEKILDDISHDTIDANAFELSVSSWLSDVYNSCVKNQQNKQELEKKLSSIITIDKSKPSYPCQNCGENLKLLTGKFGKFFVCPHCNSKYSEINGKPMPVFNEKIAPKCPKCKGALKLLNFKNGLFWHCQNNRCGIFIPDMRGQPQLGKKCPKCGQELLFKLKGPYGYYNKCANCKSVIK